MSWIAPRWSRKMTDGWGTWKEIHENNLRRLRDAEVEANGAPLDLVMYGDSITACLFDYPLPKAPGCAQVWKTIFGDIRAVPLAAAGDKIGNLLWRFAEGGEKPSKDPKVVAILVGVNDLIGWGEILNIPRIPSTKSRMERLLRTMCASMPTSKVKLLALTPVNGTILRLKRHSLNKTYKFLAEKLRKEGLSVEFMDCAASLAAENGGPIKSGILADGVHLTASGHELHLSALRSRLEL